MRKHRTSKRKVVRNVARATRSYAYLSSEEAKLGATPAVSRFAQLPSPHNLLALLNERLAEHSIVEEASHWMKVCPFTYISGQEIPEPARRGMAHFLIANEIRKSGLAPPQSRVLVSLLGFLEEGDNLDWVVHTAKLIRNGISPEEDAKMAKFRRFMRQLGAPEDMAHIAEHSRKMKLATQSDKVNNVATLKAFSAGMGLGHIVARGGGYAERLLNEVAEAVDIYSRK
ncbi:MAG: hypothetical protein HY544_03415 [Candidatus Diapherotrites archaeon]|uniref:Uncharacterized protein n=1 Tax=Candidatus Iainarchaeum sp. TaxID=3101447 RepID=A0A8T3YLJ6_9ARCH|nr:hypothetical protein [Candidatus Diapherotrites archaeon]